VSGIHNIECDADLESAKFARADATTLQPAAEPKYGPRNLVTVFSEKLAGTTSGLELAVTHLSAFCFKGAQLAHLFRGVAKEFPLNMGLEEHLERFQSRFRCLHEVPRELPVNRAVSGLFWCRARRNFCPIWAEIIAHLCRSPASSEKGKSLHKNHRHEPGLCCRLRSKR
jgi:hypothetical protein